MNKEDLKGRKCHGGMDLASSTDLNAFVLFFPADEEFPLHALLPFFWIPEDKIKNNRDRVDYQQWVDDGYLYKTPGGVIDHRFVSKTISDLQLLYTIETVAVDPSHTYHGVVQDLADADFEIVSYNQRHWNYNDPIDEFEKMIKQKSLKHWGNPILRWMVGNVVINTNSEGKRKPDKAKSKNKIDGVAAALMAIGEWMRLRSEVGSVYETSGLKTL